MVRADACVRGPLSPAFFPAPHYLLVAAGHPRARENKEACRAPSGGHQIRQRRRVRGDEDPGYRGVFPCARPVVAHRCLRVRRALHACPYLYPFSLAAWRTWPRSLQRGRQGRAAVDAMHIDSFQLGLDDQMDAAFAASLAEGGADGKVAATCAPRNLASRLSRSPPRAARPSS